MIIANVILATQMPYVMVLFFCLLVILLEAACFFTFQRHTVGFGAALGLVALANIVSWAAGMIITEIIPVPYGFAAHESRPEYFYGIMIGFILAFFLSWLIEHRVINGFRKRFAFCHLGRTTGIANFASYSAVFIAMMWRF